MKLEKKKNGRKSPEYMIFHLPTINSLKYPLEEWQTHLLTLEKERKVVQIKVYRERLNFKEENMYFGRLKGFMFACWKSF